MTGSLCDKATKRTRAEQENINVHQCACATSQLAHQHDGRGCEDHTSRTPPPSTYADVKCNTSRVDTHSLTHQQAAGLDTGGGALGKCRCAGAVTDHIFGLPESHDENY
jgi:hypothetical protein